MSRTTIIHAEIEDFWCTKKCKAFLVSQKPKISEDPENILFS
tara:strand:+ start:5213 stop:5338 length:126 start_codon:yes stop_codon:yes gene_type:complete